MNKTWTRSFIVCHLLWLIQDVSCRASPRPSSGRIYSSALTRTSKEEKKWWPLMARKSGPWITHTHTHSRLLWPRHTSFCCTACEACGQSTHLLCCFVLGLPHCRRGGGCLLCLQPLSNCSCRMATLHEPASWRNVSSVALRCLMMAKKNHSLIYG